MKILKIIFIVILVLCLGTGVALFIFIKNFDINKYQSQISSHLGSQLNRKISIGKLKLDVAPDRGAVLSITGFSVADDPQFSIHNFLSIEHLDLKVDIMSLVRDRKLRVLGINIKSPRVTVIRDRNGRLNTETLGPQKAAPSTPAGTVSGSSSGHTANTEASFENLPSLNISSFKLTDGEARYIDKTNTKEMVIDVSDISLEIDNFNFDTASVFSLKADVWDAQQTLKGKMSVNPQKMKFMINDANLTLDFSQINLKKMFQSLQSVEGIDSIKQMTGRAYASVNTFVAGYRGLEDISATGEVANGSVKLKQLAIAFDRIQGTFKADKSNFTVNTLSCNLGKGSIKADFRLEDYFNQQNFKYTARAEAIDFEEIVDQRDQPIKLHGKLYARIEGGGKSVDPNALTGQGSLEVKEGQLKDINILNMVLSKISMIPNLVEKVEENFPEKYKKMLNKKDTDISKLGLDFTIRSSQLTINPAVIEGDGFVLGGRGTLDFEQNLFLQSAVSIPQDLSLSIVKSSGQMQYLLNDQKEIFIPLRDYRGPVAAFKPFPDLEYLGKKFFAQKGREELQKVLDRAFGREEKQGGDNSNPPETEPQGQEAQPETQPQKKSPEEEIIGTILDTIFN